MSIAMSSRLDEIVDLAESAHVAWSEFVGRKQRWRCTSYSVEFSGGRPPSRRLSTRDIEAEAHLQEIHRGCPSICVGRS